MTKGKLVSSFIAALSSRIPDESVKTTLDAVVKEIDVAGSVDNFLEERRRRNELRDQYMLTVIGSKSLPPSHYMRDQEVQKNNESSPFDDLFEGENWK